MNLFDRNSIHLTFYTILYSQQKLSSRCTLAREAGTRLVEKYRMHTGQKTEREDLQLYSTTTYYAKWYNKEQFRSGE